MLKAYCPPHRPHLHRSGNRSRSPTLRPVRPARTAARRARNKPAPGPVSHCADGAIQKRRGLFPIVEMEIHVKKFLLAILLIIGVAGCAPLTAQQKEAIDYQNHRPWSGG